MTMLTKLAEFWRRRLRDAQVEFESPTRHVDDRIELELRPDIVTINPLYDFSPGPVALGDSSAGLLDRPWRFYGDPDDLTLYVAKANDAGDAWEADQPVHTYTGAAITELSAAFDQNGNVVIATERPTGAGGDPEVWIYFFDPTADGGNGDFVFNNFGPGRTPQAVLDNPVHPSESDVLVFYIDDANDEVRYRQQNDRYATPVSTPWAGMVETYLADAGVTGTGRVRLDGYERNVARARVSIESLLTTLYPYRAPVEGLDFSPSVEDAVLSEVVIKVEADTEGLDFSPSIEAVLLDPVIMIAAPDAWFTENPDAPDDNYRTDEEGLDFSSSMQSVALVEVVILYDVAESNGDIEGLDFSPSMQSVVLTQVVILYDVADSNGDIEGLDFAPSIQSVVLQAA